MTTESPASTTLALRQSQCVWQAGELSFLNRDGTLGWRHLAFRFTVDGEAFDSRRAEWRRIPSSSDRLSLVSRPANLPIEMTLTVTASPDGDVVQLDRIRDNERDPGHEAI